MEDDPGMTEGRICGGWAKSGLSVLPLAKNEELDALIASAHGTAFAKFNRPHAHSVGDLEG